MESVINKEFVNRKIVFTAAFFIIFVCAASVAFSIFSIPLQAATGGNPSQVALTLTINQLFMASFGILSGRIVDKAGPKRMIYIGGFIFSLGWILASFVTNVPMLYLTCGVIVGSGNGLLYNPAINVALRWYPEKRGKMSGILLCAASIGPLITAKVGALLCELYGIHGLMYLGLAYLLIIWAVGWKMEVPPDDWAKQISLNAKNAVVNFSKDYTPKQMLATRNYWLLMILFSIASTAGIMLIGTLSAIGQTQLNLTPLAAADLVAVNLFSNLCGRLVVGKLCDKIGEIETLSLVFIFTIFSLVGLSFSYHIIPFIFFLVILGASFGGVLVVYPPLTSQTFGVKNSGVNYGIMFFGYTFGSFIGPQLAARFVNKELGVKAYHSVFLMAAFVAILGFLLSLLVKKILKISK